MKAMNTDDLIQQLSREGEAVTPLPPPGMRLCAWLLGAGIYLTMMTIGIVMVMDSAVPSMSVLFVAQQAAALATAAFAVYGALSSVVPGARTSWRPLLS